MQNIVAPLANMQINADVINEDGKISTEYQRFFQNNHLYTNSLKNRSFPCTTLNPDFNILSANGTTPVSEGSPNDTEFVKKWFLWSDGGLNDFLLTPTAYSATEQGITGSLYYINMQITTLDEPLYIYNVNYSTTGQFNGAGLYSGEQLAISAAVYNNNPNTPKVRFSVMLSDGTEIESPGLFMQPGMNNVYSVLQMPDFSAVNMGLVPYAQIRLKFEDIYVSNTNLDIYYVKCELSNYATPLQINHIEQILICNAIT